MKKALAISAVSGILMGTLAACGGDKAAAEPPKAPSTDTAAPGAKGSCAAKGSCSGSAAAPATPATPATPADPTKK